MIDKYVEDLKENLKICLSKFLSRNRKVEVELSAWYQESQSYRLARNEVIQPQIEKNIRISARVISERKTGIAVTNSTLAEDILSAIETAYDLSKSQKPRLEAGLPEKPHRHFSQIELESHLFNVTKNFERISDWLLFAKEARVLLSGKFQVSRQALIVVNTNDTETAHIFPIVKIEFIAERDEISGFGSYISHQLEPFLIMNELERAVSKASHYGKVVELEPGDYEVILEPEAASELVELFSIYGFGAKMFQEGRSYISDKMGSQIFSSNVNLFDSSQEEGQIRIPFDFEGVTKQKVQLISDGIVSGVVYDTETARKEGKKSTGHALPLPNPHGPAPINLCFSPGNRTLEQMISKVERGILVTRLNYTNIEDEKNGIITGMTRDGTFLIEKGEVAEPVYDLRFTQSVPEALKRVTEVGSETKIVSPLFGYALFPPIKIEGFRITGTKKKIFMPKYEVKI